MTIDKKMNDGGTRPLARGGVPLLLTQ